MSAELSLKEQSDDLEAFLPGGKLDIFKGKKNHWVSALMASVFLSTPPDFLVPEVDGGVFPCVFKKHAKHIHIQGFAKAARPGKQGYCRQFIEHILNHQGLIDVVIIHRGSTII